MLPRNANLFQPISLSKIKKWFQFYGPGWPAAHGSWVYSRHTPMKKNVDDEIGNVT